MSSLRERLAQMAETARAATPGPWVTAFTCHGAREDRITHHVCTVDDLISLEDVERDTPDDAAGAALMAHVATFSPDVAAALVAVADALRNAYDVGAVAEWIDVEGDGPKAALDALAAALGVSR